MSEVKYGNVQSYSFSTGKRYSVVYNTDNPIAPRRVEILPSKPYGLAIGKFFSGFEYYVVSLAISKAGLQVVLADGTSLTIYEDK